MQKTSCLTSIRYWFLFLALLMGTTFALAPNIVAADGPTSDSDAVIGEIAGEYVEGLAPESASRPCAFLVRGDDVHISSSAFEASAHGWWVNLTCPTGTRAVVTVQLQQHSNGAWRNVGTRGRATVSSGGGAGNRATGRARCSSNQRTAWRSVIDVDLVGIIDDPSKLTTRTTNINCKN